MIDACETQTYNYTLISPKKKSLLHYLILSFFSKYVYSSFNNSALYLNTASYENLHFCILKVPYNQGISCSKKCQLILKYMNSCFIVWTMYQNSFCIWKKYSARKYTLKVNDKNTKKCVKCLKLTTATPERRQWRRSGVLIVNLSIFHSFS